MNDTIQDDNTECEPGAALALLPAVTYEEYLHLHPELSRVMRAREREIRIGAIDQCFFATFAPPLRIVMIAPAGLPSTAVVVPIVDRIARNLPHCVFRIVDPQVWAMTARQAQDLPPSRQQIPAGDLPIMIVLDADLRYLTDWGPHPRGFTSYLEDWIAQHRDTASGVSTFSIPGAVPVHMLRLWYNSGLNAECVSEIRKRLEIVQENIPAVDDVLEDSAADDW